MENNTDNRWLQRFSSYEHALANLRKFLNKKKLNELEEQGLIKAFELTYELAWKTIQDLLHLKGYSEINGPKPVLTQAFQDGYIDDGPGWAQLHQSHSLKYDMYDKAIAKKTANLIREKYWQLFINLQIRLERIDGKGPLPERTRGAHPSTLA